MTLVVAQRFGQRILIASDTMISDRDGRVDNRIPGRLKAVVLDPRTSAAYAGAANQAHDALRLAKRILANSGTLQDVEEALRAATGRYAGDLEFVVASHWGEPSLKKIWEGRISFEQEQVCLGQRDLLPRLEAEALDAPRAHVPSEFEAEAPFVRAFGKLFQGGTYVSPTVGGFGFVLLGSPYGHCYQDQAGVATWDVIRGGTPLSDAQLADRRSGMTQWAFHTYSPALRGVGVTGALVLNAGVGFLYSPLIRDDPEVWRFTPPTSSAEEPPLLQAFQRRIAAAAEALGGGVQIAFPPRRTTPPTEAELQVVMAYAAAAPLATRLELRDHDVWIQCGVGYPSQGFAVGFAALDPDPVAVLKTAIDRVNAELVASRQGCHAPDQGPRPGP